MTEAAPSSNQHMNNEGGQNISVAAGSRGGEMMHNRKLKFRSQMILWRNRLRFDIRLDESGRRRRVILHERFKTIVRWVKLSLTLGGLLLSFITFSSVWVSFLVGVVVWLATTVVEKIGFSYDSVFVYPLPQFEIKPELWLGTYFGYGETADGMQIPRIGLIVKDRQYAFDLHGLILSWTNGELNDEEKRVCVSVIMLSESEYIFFCYPNIRHSSTTWFFEQKEIERRNTSLTDVQNKYLSSLVLGKRCQVSAHSYFPTFHSRYQDGVPYLFGFTLFDKHGNPHQLSELPQFVFHTLKIKHLSDLNESDIEYDLIRVMGI